METIRFPSGLPFEFFFKFKYVFLLMQFLSKFPLPYLKHHLRLLYPVIKKF